MTPVLDLLAHAASLNCGKDRRSAEGGHWTERSEGSGCSDSETPNSLFFAKQKATNIFKIKTRYLILRIRFGISVLFGRILKKITFLEGILCLKEKNTRNLQNNN